MSKESDAPRPQWFRVLLLAVPILAIFVGTALGIAQLVSWWTDTPITSATSIYLGIICGLAIWLFIAIFHIKREIILLPYEDREALMTGLKAQLEELGYEPGDAKETEVHFRPAFHAVLFGGAIRVEVDDHSAKIVGPKVYLERLRHGLRMKSQISRVQQTFRDARNRTLPAAPSGPLLRKVRIAGRLNAEQLRAFHAEVVQPLIRDGGNVSCEFNLSAQAEPGIHESVVETTIRRWLQHHQITAEIQTEPAAPPAPQPSPPTPETVNPA